MMSQEGVDELTTVAAAGSLLVTPAAVDGRTLAVATEDRHRPTGSDHRALVRDSETRHDVHMTTNEVGADSHSAPPADHREATTTVSTTAAITLDNVGSTKSCESTLDQGEPPADSKPAPNTATLQTRSDLVHPPSTTTILAHGEHVTDARDSDANNSCCVDRTVTESSAADASTLALKAARALGHSTDARDGDGDASDVDVVMSDAAVGDKAEPREGDAHVHDGASASSELDATANETGAPTTNSAAAVHLQLGGIDTNSDNVSSAVPQPVRQIVFSNETNAVVAAHAAGSATRGRGRPPTDPCLGSRPSEVFRIITETGKSPIVSAVFVENPPDSLRKSNFFYFTITFKDKSNQTIRVDYAKFEEFVETTETTMPDRRRTLARNGLRYTLRGVSNDPTPTIWEESLFIRLVDATPEHNIIVYEGQDRVPELHKVLLTHESICTRCVEKRQCGNLQEAPSDPIIARDKESLTFYAKCNQNCLKFAGNPKDVRRFQVAVLISEPAISPRSLLAFSSTMFVHNNSKHGRRVLLASSAAASPTVTSNPRRIAAQLTLPAVSSPSVTSNANHSPTAVTTVAASQSSPSQTHTPASGGPGGAPVHVSSTAPSAGRHMPETEIRPEIARESTGDVAQKRRVGRPSKSDYTEVRIHPSAFEPEILEICPPQGPLGGSQIVTIIGEHFKHGTKVSFGSSPPLPARYISPSAMTILTPRRDEPGEVYVTLWVNGERYGRRPGRYIYAPESLSSPADGMLSESLMAVVDRLSERLPPRQADPPFLRPEDVLTRAVEYIDELRAVVDSFYGQHRAPDASHPQGQQQSQMFRLKGTPLPSATGMRYKSPFPNQHQSQPLPPPSAMSAPPYGGRSYYPGTASAFAHAMLYGGSNGPPKHAYGGYPHPLPPPDFALGQNPRSSPYQSQQLSLEGDEYAYVTRSNAGSRHSGYADAFSERGRGAKRPREADERDYGGRSANAGGMSDSDGDADTDGPKLVSRRGVRTARVTYPGQEMIVNDALYFHEYRPTSSPPLPRGLGAPGSGRSPAAAMPPPPTRDHRASESSAGSDDERGRVDSEYESDEGNEGLGEAQDELTDSDSSDRVHDNQRRVRTRQSSIGKDTRKKSGVEEKIKAVVRRWVAEPQSPLNTTTGPATGDTPAQDLRHAAKKQRKR